ncbi:MAG: HlyC/CorC family transporter [Actinomycetia bacterium]|nr:HlyC/CorC family transporter [Actinomycetes bacterium]MCP4223988.1 HlyC/CorC family transporter [Actinomycetes bacterium]MCP5031232.1 HlyC/CorC family transporter [Actinomycetes bacterium]
MMLGTQFGSGDVVALAAAVILLLLAVALVAAEEALTRTNAVRAEVMFNNDPRRAARLIRILEEPEAVINPLRFVVLLVQLTETTLIATLANRFMSWPLTVVAVAINVCVVFVVAEAVPRTLGILRADRTALILAGPVELVARFAPIRLLANALISLTNVIVPGKGLREGPFSSALELIALADAAVEDDVIDQEERDLIESVIEFGGTIVREVMVPRTDMTTIPRHLTVEEALEVTSSVGYSRVPVLGDSVDDVVGLVYVKDLIRAELDGKPDQRVDDEDLIRTSQFVPETKKVADLLKEMQSESFHMAMAVDEYGGIAGLVTLEDLIEELVGEIVDEYDNESDPIEEADDGTLRVDARISINDLNEQANVELPEGDWDTVGGLVFDRFGRVPTVGDVCLVNGYPLRVERLQGRRITRVSISQPNPAGLDPVSEGVGE